MADKSSSLFRLAQERALSKKKAEEEKKKHEQSLKPYVSRDCVSNLLIRLPLESLQRSRFVCKPWYKIINAPKFIEAHLSRSENSLIFQSRVWSTQTNPHIPNTFSIEAKLFEIQSIPILTQPNLNARFIYKMQYMEIRDCKSNVVDYNATCFGQIRASCNGVIVLENKLKKGGLIAFNPITRKTKILPVGTIFPSHEESYALAFCNSTKQFKLVHLYRDELRYIGCEILDIGARSWRMVDGPCFGLIGWFGYDPVHAIDALHWVPHVDGNEYIVSISVENENFHKILLPVTSGGTPDRLVEIRGLLGFVAHVDTDQIDIYVLKSLFGENWVKQHSIGLSPFSLVCVRDMVPIYCTKIDGELVFRNEKDGTIHAYDFRIRVMRKVEIEKGSNPIGVRFVPHVNSLVSWETYGDGENMDD